MAKFISFDFKRNFNNATRKDSIVESMMGALAPVFYVTIPSLFKLNGWTALLTGTASTWLAGALLGVPGLRSGAIATAMTHITYAKFSGQLASWGIPAWTLGGNNVGYAQVTGGNTTAGNTAGNTSGGTTNGLARLRGLRGYMQPNTRQITLPNGQVVASRPMATQRALPQANLSGYNAPAEINEVVWNKDDKEFKVN